MTLTANPDGRSLVRDWDLRVALRSEVSGPDIHEVALADADLAEALSEAWLAGCLRRGFPQLALADVTARLLPDFARHSPAYGIPDRPAASAAPSAARATAPAVEATNPAGSDPAGSDPAGSGLAGSGLAACNGFTIELERPGGRSYRKRFPLTCLEHVASREAQRLQTTGALPQDELYYFRLLARARRKSPATQRSDAGLFTTRSQPQALVSLAVPLEFMLRQAEPVGDPAQESLPVFYTEQALIQAEHQSRRGAETHPPLETGAVLLGSLCACPDSGEFFAVVCDALEVRDAEQTSRSFTYSGKSWDRIQTVITARQSQLATRSHRLLGQAHGHNFRPSSDPPCAECEKAPECPRTSAVASTEDRTWSRAVFPGQPWHLCHIFGLDARGEAADALFGLRHGRLAARGYHVIPDFDTAGWPLVAETASAATGPAAPGKGA